MSDFKEFILSHQEIVVILIKVLAIFVVIMGLNRVLRAIFGRAKKKLRGKKTVWRKSLFDAVELPVKIALWGEGAVIGTRIIAKYWHITEILQQMGRINTVLCVVLLGWFLVRWGSFFEKGWRKIRGTDELTTGLKVDVIGRLFKIIVVIFVAVIALDAFNVNLTALLTFGGIGMAAVGLASKDVIANFFGGFMIYVTRPFTIGDWVSSPDRDIEGTVDDIGWYMTKIFTFAKRPIYVPNSVFSNVVVINNSRMLNRRIKETFGVRYKDIERIDPIVQDIRTMLKTHPEIDQERVILVHLVSFGKSTLDIEVYTFTKTSDWEEWLNIQQEIFLKIGDIIKKHGAQMAFPTRTLDLPDELLHR
jgi:MscS family membrane protein